MKATVKNQPSPGRNELGLAAAGLAVLAAGAVPVLIGLGPAAEGMVGVMCVFLFGFMGLGILAAVLISRLGERPETAREDDTWC